MDLQTGDVISSCDGFDAVWSPDGSRVAYKLPWELRLLEPRSGETVSLARHPVTAPLSDLVRGPLPAWSPDGRFIVCPVAGHRGNQEFQIADVVTLLVLELQAEACSVLWMDPPLELLLVPARGVFGH